MRALLFDGSAVKFRQYHPDPTPAPEEALVAVQLAGLCQTDLEIAKGYMGFTGVLGHEFVGTVLKVNSKSANAQALVGQRVVGEINCVCSKCDLCLRGLSSHCRQRTVLGIAGRDGAFADLLTLPLRNLHAVPANVSDEEAVFTEPLAAAVQVLKQTPIDARTKVMVLGDGRLGQLVAQVVHKVAPQLNLVGKHPEKLVLAERLGIRTVLDKDVQGRQDQDVVIECTGKTAGFQRALTLLRPRGTLVLKSTVAEAQVLDLAPVVINEIAIIGSRCGPFREALGLLGQKQVDVTALISRRVKLAAAEGLFSAPLPPNTLKVLLTFDR